MPFYTDSRVRARNAPNQIEEFNVSSMTGYVFIGHNDGDNGNVDRLLAADVPLHDLRKDGDIYVSVKCAYRVCPTCEGRGSHVNPSIDCDGLTAENFDDSDFMEDYFNGVYDVACYECKGLRVSPEILQDNHPEILKILQEIETDYYEVQAEYEAEQRWGA